MPSMTEILVLQGLLPIEQLDVAENDPAAGDLAIQELLLEGRISPQELAEVRATQAGVPFVNLVETTIDNKVATMIPPSICRRHTVLPIRVEGEHLVLAMADPGDVFALDDVNTATQMRVKPVVAEKHDLENAIDRFLRADDEISSLTSTLVEESPSEETVDRDLVESDDDVPIVRFVNLLVSQAIQDRASDIHIEPAEREVRVRYRIDGVMHEMQAAPKSIQNGVVSRLKIMSDIDIAERRRPQDGRMSVSHGGRQIDLRVATLPTVWGEKIVLRILDNSSATLDVRELGMVEDNFERYSTSFTKPYGMILVTGPTGSGKSTTLYATVNAISRPEVNVITVEDPVEYRMAGINQVQVNPKAGLTFASALRSILRSDPDVVLIGEIRDYETAQIAVEASLTGHLVLSTLHTNDAPSAVTRLTEMGVEPYLVGSALESVVAQRLVRRLCERCKRAVTPDTDQLVKLGFVTEGEEPVEIFEAVGCPACSNTGYRGRMALHEVMTVSEEVGRLAVERASSGEIARVAHRQGMRSLRGDGWTKVQRGWTSIDEILRVVA